MSYEESYTQILNEAESIRKAVIDNNIDNLSFGGSMSQEDARRIKLAIDIENVIFGYLMVNKGLTYEEIEGKPNMIRFTIDGSTYIGQKSLLTKTLKENYPEISHVNVTKPQPEEQTQTKVIEEDEEPLEFDEDDIGEEDTYEDNTTEEEIQEEEIIEETPATQTPTNIISTSDLIYQKLKISICHKGYEDAAEEFDVMCAPLKISRVVAPTVPIIVHFSRRSTQITRSSYDSSESGRNLVPIEIKDYSLLIRGSFDANGRFNTSIVTTDKSTAQGDILKLIDEQTYGVGSKSKIGHPVLSYESDEGPSTLSVFPLGDIGDENFIVMCKTDEFVDYKQSSSDTNGAFRATVEDNGITKTVIPHWDNNNLEVELLGV